MKFLAVLIVLREWALAAMGKKHNHTELCEVVRAGWREPQTLDLNREPLLFYLPRYCGDLASESTRCFVTCSPCYRVAVVKRAGSCEKCLDMVWLSWRVLLLRSDCKYCKCCCDRLGFYSSKAPVLLPLLARREKELSKILWDITNVVKDKSASILCWAFY